MSSKSFRAVLPYLREDELERLRVVDEVARRIAGQSYVAKNTEGEMVPGLRYGTRPPCPPPPLRCRTPVDMYVPMSYPGIFSVGQLGCGKPERNTETPLNEGGKFRHPLANKMNGGRAPYRARDRSESRRSRD